jgi:hypothetical protein
LENEIKWAEPVRGVPEMFVFADDDIYTTIGDDVHKSASFDDVVGIRSSSKC